MKTKCKCRSIISENCFLIKKRVSVLTEVREKRKQREKRDREAEDRNCVSQESQALCQHQLSRWSVCAANHAGCMRLLSGWARFSSSSRLCVSATSKRAGCHGCGCTAGAAAGSQGQTQWLWAAVAATGETWWRWQSWLGADSACSIRDEAEH